eukprot:g7704.t1
MTTRAATPQVLVPVANGSEEIELTCIVDVLRRAGAEVTIASVEESPTVTCSRGTRIVADTSIEAVAARDIEFDLVALPGGMPGAERLRDSACLKSVLQAHREALEPWVAAVCAAPAVVLEAHGLLQRLAGESEGGAGGEGDEGARVTATCHPSFADALGPGRSASRVVVDAKSKVITSQGPGTSLEFALQLVERCLYSSCGYLKREKSLERYVENLVS